MKIENLQLEEALNATVYVTGIELNSGGGSQGATGPIGPTGAQGNDGSVGHTGPTGAQGNDGSVGHTGPTGSQGNDGSVGPTGPTGPGSNFPDGTSNGNYIFWNTTSDPEEWTVGGDRVTIGQDAGKNNPPDNAILIGKNAGYSNIVNNTLVVGKGNNTIYYGFQNKWTPLTNDIFTECNAVFSISTKTSPTGYQNAVFTGIGSYAIAECFFNPTTAAITGFTGIQQDIISTGNCIVNIPNGLIFGGNKGTISNSVITQYDLTEKQFFGLQDSANYLSTCYSITYVNNGVYFGGIPVDSANGCVYVYTNDQITSSNNTLLKTCYKLFYYIDKNIQTVFASGEKQDNNDTVLCLNFANNWIPLSIKDSQGNNIFTVIYDFVINYIDPDYNIISVGSNNGKGIISYTKLIISGETLQTTSIDIPNIFDIAGRSIRYSSTLQMYEAVGEGTNTFAYSYDGLNWFPYKVDTLNSGLGLRIFAIKEIGDNIAIGTGAGQNNQGKNSVAIGTNAGYTGQQISAVAIGTGAGKNNQGSYSIAIGTNAGYTGQASYSIGLNASGKILNPTSSGFYVKPITPAGNETLLNYNTDTGSINYTNITNNTNTPNILSYNLDNKSIEYTNITQSATTPSILTYNALNQTINYTTINSSGAIPSILTYDESNQTVNYTPIIESATTPSILTYDKDNKTINYTDISSSVKTPSILTYDKDNKTINYTDISQSSLNTQMLTYNEDNKTINYSPISSLGYTTCSASTTTTNGGVGPMYILNNTGNIVNISISSSDLSNNIPINQISDKSQLFIPAKIIWVATDTNGNPAQVNTVSLS